MIRPSTPESISEAASALVGGRLIGLPTETVYGLGSDAANVSAIKRIFALKNRPADHPLIVHIQSADHLDNWATDITEMARELASYFWPGPLTLILQRHSLVPAEVSGGRSTIGLRAPAHPVAQLILAEFGGGIAAPSANRFGRVSPTTAQHVLDEFGNAPDLALIVDGGPCTIGVESTIVDVTTSQPKILRHGKISAEDISLRLGVDIENDVGGESRASGMLAAHYQPTARVVLAGDPEQANQLVASLSAINPSAPIYRLPLYDSVESFACDLYNQLRTADAVGASTIVVVMPPSSPGLANAIRDRLSKAAHR